MPFRTISALTALLCSLAAFAVAQPAVAAQLYKTTVFVSEKYPAFHGSISSADDSCLGGRLVVVTRQLNGKRRHVGSAFTNAAGRWKVKVNLTSGEYWVTVPSSGADCGGTRSQPVVVD